MDCKERLEQCLTAAGGRFRETSHPAAYTAQDLAYMEHIPGRLVAKVVMAKSVADLYMLVLPATRRVDLNKAAVAVGVPHLQLAKETEFSACFPDCEVGAMPPFGSLYGLRVCVDQTLAADPEITFAAGSHRLSLTVPYADFARVVQPAVADFSRSGVREN